MIAIIERFIESTTASELIGLLEMTDAETGRDDSSAFADLHAEAHGFFFVDECPEWSFLYDQSEAVERAMQELSPRIRKVFGPHRAEEVGDFDHFPEPAKTSERMLRNIACLRWVEDSFRLKDFAVELVLRVQ
jgi:hypothetical protein